MGGLEASDPLQFIPPPTLTLRMGDFLLVYVKITKGSAGTQAEIKGIKQ